MIAVIHRIAVGALIGLGLFGIVSHGLLLGGAPVAGWALPASLALGVALAGSGPWSQRDTSGRLPVSVAVALALLLASAVAAVAYGSLATPARDWDGFIAYEIKAAFLTLEPTLRQDFFMGDGVYCHSRDYPLLQPLTIAAGNRLLGDGYGRLLFPLLYLATTALVAAAVRAGSGDRRIAALAAVGFAVTPMLVGKTLGGADSGYGELLLATTVAGVAAALILEDPRLMAASVLCAVLAKPEGLVYGVLPIVVCWCRGPRRLLIAAVSGLGLGAALWLPLQHQLQQRDPTASNLAVVVAAVAVFAVVVLGSDALLRRREASTRRRLWIAAIALPVVLLVLPLLSLWFGAAGGTMTVYLEDANRPLERLDRLPRIVGGLFDHAFGRMKFALSYILLAAAGLGYAVRRRRPPALELFAFLGLGLLCCLAPFLLSPEDDTSHHIRSTMSRLLLHWLGAVWILSGLWVADQLREAPAPAVGAEPG